MKREQGEAGVDILEEENQTRGKAEGEDPSGSRITDTNGAVTSAYL